MPTAFQLAIPRPSTTSALERLARGAINRQGEEILGLDKIGDEPVVHDEVAEAEGVEEEDRGEDDIEHALPGLGAARGKVLEAHRGVEGLVEREGPICVREGKGGRGAVVPVVDQGGVQAGLDDCAAGHYSEGFGDGGNGGVECAGCGHQLG